MCRREDDMSWSAIASEWQELRGRVRSRWGRLTDEDVRRIAGRREQLVGLLIYRYGYTQKQAEREVDEWTSAMSVERRAARSH